MFPFEQLTYEQLLNTFTIMVNNTFLRNDINNKFIFIIDTTSLCQSEKIKKTQLDLIDFLKSFHHNDVNCIISKNDTNSFGFDYHYFSIIFNDTTITVDFSPQFDELVVHTWVQFLKPNLEPNEFIRLSFYRDLH